MDQNLVLIAAGALAGGFINGMAGFGTALFALGFFLQVLPPMQAVGLTLVLSLTAGLPGLWVVRHAILDNPSRSARFLLPALIGIPLGASALPHVDTELLKLLISVCMILYGAFFMARHALPRFERPTPLADSAVGFAGGVLGGLAGLSGVLPAMWCALRPWPRHETRAVLQPFNFVILFICAAILATRGAYPAVLWPEIAVAVALASLSAQAGIALFRRMTDSAFRWLLVGLMLASGLVLVLQTIL